MKKKIVFPMMISTLILGNLVLWPLLLIKTGVISLQDETASGNLSERKSSFDMEKILSKYIRSSKDSSENQEATEEDLEPTTSKTFEVIDIQ